MTTHVRTGLGSSITFHRSVAAQAKIASPLVALPIDAALHEGLDASQVVVHGPVTVRSLLGAAHHHIQLVLDILATHEPAPIDVQVAAGDRRAASYPCELPDGGFADDGHSTSRSRRDW